MANNVGFDSEPVVYVAPIVVDAGPLLDPSRALDAAKDLARALQRHVNLVTIVGNYQIVYYIEIHGIRADVVQVGIDVIKEGSML